MARGYDNPMLPLRYVANMFKEQTLDAIENNLMTQKIWPYEVYPGYKMTNDRRQQEGGWFSTGKGARSFEGHVVEADEDKGRVTLSFRYNEYMKFVDMGVGAGRKISDVDRARKANYKRRYINKWIPSAGVSHRPAISMEFRHLASRLQSYCYDFYGNELEYRVLNTFDGLGVVITP